MRYLIVNADDFGLSPGVNAGIIEAHEHGVVTSTSLMVRRRAAAEAAAYAATRPQLSVGLHLDLGEWEFRNGTWTATREVAVDQIQAEIGAQLAVFRDLIGREPTHVDSHQHAHLREPAASAVRLVGNELGVPVRRIDPRITYCGSFYGQADTGESFPDLITAEALRSLVAGLGEGITELGCHPGYTEPGESTYAAERATEVASLCDSTVRDAIADWDVELISFRDIESLTGGEPR